MKIQFTTIKTMTIVLCLIWHNLGLATAIIPTISSPIKHHIVLQISTANPVVQQRVITNVTNILKYFGEDTVQLELVAYGPGLSFLTQGNRHKEWVETMAVHSNVVFSACANTMKRIELNTGKKPVLSKGVGIVPGGIIRVIELQELGYVDIIP